MVLLAAGACASEEEKKSRESLHYLLIRLMATLTKNSDVVADEECKNQCTTLEHSMRAFELLLRLQCVRRQLEDRDITNMRILLKEQSILACLEDGDYNLARAVCHRQYNFCPDKVVKNSLHKIHKVLLKPDICDLSNFSKYSDLMNLSKEIICKIFAAMSPPI